MRFMLVALLTVPLSGCWFVYIPGSLIDSLAGGGSYCVPETAKVGTRVNINGQTGKVTQLSGRSSRCQDGLMPIRADVEFE